MKRLVSLILPLALLACKADVSEPIAAPVSGEMVARGASIVNGLGACGFCHGVATNPAAPLSGGRVVHDVYGAVRAANITPSKSGLGTWSVNEVTDALRGVTGKDGYQLSTTVHSGMEWMSDNDLISVIAYLRSLQPVDNNVERRSISFLDRNTTGILEVRRKVEGYVPDVDRRYPIQFGQYLVENVARCTACHSTPEGVVNSEVYLGGGSFHGEGESKDAPDISGADQHGTGSWSEKEMVHFLRTGERPDSSNVDPEACPVNYFRNGSDEELLAIAQYLRSFAGS